MVVNEPVNNRKRMNVLNSVVLCMRTFTDQISRAWFGHHKVNALQQNLA